VRLVRLGARGGYGLVFCLGAMDIRQQGLVGEWWGCVRLKALWCAFGALKAEVGGLDRGFKLES
jgi:hypothetical protein